MAQGRETSVRFYSIANSAYFLGLVGLVNSVRANGHEEPIAVVDAGLNAGQRAVMAPHVDLVDGPNDVPALFLKDVGMRALPADVMIYLDADVLCVAHLAPLVDEAAMGRILVFEDRLALFPNERSGSPPPVYHAWEERLGLRGMASKPYANAGMMILPRDRGLELLAVLKDSQTAIDNEETYVGSMGIARPRDPFYYGDQDLMNAFLADARYAESTTTLPHARGASPPYDGLSAAATGITCDVRAGTEPPYLLHQILSKPWLARMQSDVYFDLLVRALDTPVGPVRIDRESLPTFLRADASGERARRRRGYVAALETRVRGRVGIRRALSDRRRRRALASAGSGTPGSLQDVIDAE